MISLITHIKHIFCQENLPLLVHSLTYQHVSQIKHLCRLCQTTFLSRSLSLSLSDPHTISC